MAEVMEAKPADDPTLQAMTICFREMQKRKRLQKIKAEKFCYVQALLYNLWYKHIYYRRGGKF